MSELPDGRGVFTEVRFSRFFLTILAHWRSKMKKKHIFTTFCILSLMCFPPKRISAFLPCSRKNTTKWVWTEWSFLYLLFGPMERKQTKLALTYLFYYYLYNIDYKGYTNCTHRQWSWWMVPWRLCPIQIPNVPLEMFWWWQCPITSLGHGDYVPLLSWDMRQTMGYSSITYLSYIYVWRCSRSRVHPEINQPVVKYWHLAEVHPEINQTVFYRHQLSSMLKKCLEVSPTFPSVSAPHWQWPAPRDSWLVPYNLLQKFRLKCILSSQECP